MYVDLKISKFQLSYLTKVRCQSRIEELTAGWLTLELVVVANAKKLDSSLETPPKRKESKVYRIAWLINDKCSYLVRV